MQDEYKSSAHRVAEIDAAVDGFQAHAADSSVHMTGAEKQKLRTLENYDDTELRGEIAEKADASALGAVANAGAKNIVNNTASASRVVSGVTWVKNPDGSMSASGTSTGASAVRVVGVQGQSSYAAAVPIPKGRYTISASGFDQTRFRIVLGFFENENAERKITYVYNEEVDFVVTSDTARYDFSCIITVEGVTVSGETWHPMIRRAEIEDDTFVPYAPSNRELYEMILAMQQNRSTEVNAHA